MRGRRVELVKQRRGARRSGLLRPGGSVALLLLAVIGLSACAAKTTGASNVTATSAELHATVQCDTGESCAWYWEYWPASAPRSSSTKTQVFGPFGQTPPHLPLTQHVTGLDPNTPYRWVFCGSINGGGNYLCAGPHGHFDTPSADPPADYDTFNAAPGAWNLQTPANVGQLGGVSCTSATWCMAGGQVWNGTAWTYVPRPNVGSSGSAGDLDSVSCTSPTACMAVGNYRQTLYSPFGTLLIERWDGSAWTVQSVPTPTGTTTSGLAGVSCVSSTDCTAVGQVTVNLNTFEVLIEHWDGAAWTVKSAPNVSGDTFESVSCSSSTACLAVGSGGLAERWDGSTWTLLGPPQGATTADLGGVSCVSAVDCTVAGQGPPNGDTLIEHWNGTTWTVASGYQPEPGLLNGVSCTSPSACVAVGYQFLPSGSTIALIDRLRGTSWTAQTVQLPAGPTRDQSLHSVSCLPALPCTAVGSYSGLASSPGGLLIERSAS